MIWYDIGNRTWAFQVTCYWTPKIQDGGDPPSWMLTPKCKTRFSGKLRNLELWCPLSTCRNLLDSMKSKMTSIRYLENRHNVIFFCRRWSDLDKISETGAEWYVDGGDVVEIETRCRIPIWRTFGRISWHVIPEPPATLQGVRIPSCHVRIPLPMTHHWLAHDWSSDRPICVIVLLNDL